MFVGVVALRQSPLTSTTRAIGSDQGNQKLGFPMLTLQNLAVSTFARETSSIFYIHRPLS